MNYLHGLYFDHRRIEELKEKLRKEPQNQFLKLEWKTLKRKYLGLEIECELCGHKRVIDKSLSMIYCPKCHIPYNPLGWEKHQKMVCDKLSASCLLRENGIDGKVQKPIELIDVLRTEIFQIPIGTPLQIKNRKATLNDLKEFESTLRDSNNHMGIFIARQFTRPALDFIPRAEKKEIKIIVQLE